MRERIVEGLVPCVEPDLAEGRGTDDGDDGDAQQQELCPLRRAQESAKHYQHPRREAHSCHQRSCGGGQVGLLTGSISHGGKFPSKRYEKRHAALSPEVHWAYRSVRLPH